MWSKRGLLDPEDGSGDVEGHLIIITNEVGQGIIPATELSRHYRDHAGWLNQAVAQIADKVVWMVAGIPVTVKGGRE